MLILVSIHNVIKKLHIAHYFLDAQYTEIHFLMDKQLFYCLISSV